ncbi:MAG TPA: tannase/feruloyl esterase family alpha/beta hydrolase [Pseudonocardiaceae bacterium]|nr:tannase/feruloyl esterase family alpha/beta hydrolase [Pseudonocardiaceae bacterium]
MRRIPVLIAAAVPFAALIPLAGFAAASPAPAVAGPACASLPVAAPAGARIQSVQAVQQQGGTVSFPQTLVDPPVTYTDVPAYCAATITLTHPGAGDHVTVQVDLPESGWTGRLQAIGGSAYTAGDFGSPMVGAVRDGYVSVTTDAGVPLTYVDSSWGLTAQGKVNKGLLADFATRSVHEEAVLGKEVTQSFYHRMATDSYWNGCSTGGRQGYAEAQDYPKDFNGILASSPAIMWSQFEVATIWPQTVMYSLHDFPTNCEFEAFRQAAIKACDANDGVVNGIIDDPDACNYDPRSLVGTTVPCNGTNVTVTAADAEVVREIWAGPTDPAGHQLWRGLPKGAAFDLLASTSTDPNGNPVAPGFVVPVGWVRNFVEKQPGFDTSKITKSQFAGLFYQSVREYDGIIGTSNPNLTAFRAAGGKLLTVIGSEDQAIPPDGSLLYRQEVQALMGGANRVDDFYRLFLDPGVGHCGAEATGPVPTDPLGAVLDWVEHGTAPATLPAASTDGTSMRDLCAYPMVSRYISGDPSVAASYHCTR